MLVSKLKPQSDILAAHEATGHAHFGENYIQELVDKAEQVRFLLSVTCESLGRADQRTATSIDPMAFHWSAAEQQVQAAGRQAQSHVLLTMLIRVIAIPNLFALETLDTIKKADLLEKALAPEDRKLNVFLQVNTSSEESKAGLSPIKVEASSTSVDSTGDLVQLAKHVLNDCPHLTLKGLMTIGSYEASHDQDAPNPDFENLKETRKHLAKILEREEDSLELSMGMSADYAAAIKAGSDNVRVGSKAFGQRPSKEEAKEQREKEKERKAE